MKNFRNTIKTTLTLYHVLSTRIIILATCLISCSFQEINSKNNGPVTSIIAVSAGWTDNGKSHICDWLAPHLDYCVRAQGISASGQKITRNKHEYVFYHIPVGILTPHIICYLTAGMIIDLKRFFKEIDDLETQKHTVKERVKISTGAHLLMPYHVTLDILSAQTGLKKSAMGIRNGACSASADKRLGIGIRIADLMGDSFPEILKKNLTHANEIITKIYAGTPISYTKTLAEFTEYKKKLKPFVRDRVELKINHLLSQGKHILFEGAHGTYMDITHGAYPDTAAGGTITAAICADSGSGLARAGHVIGVVKAYTTYPGTGNFPTEILDKTVTNKIQKSVSKTAKGIYRYGWPDMVMIRFANMLNGFDSLAITRLDDLDGLDKIYLCIDYDIDGKHFDFPPPMLSQMRLIKPHYVELPGWQTVKNAKSFSDLPVNARIFIKKLEAMCSVPVSIVSVGPEQDQTFLVNDFGLITNKSSLPQSSDHK